MNLDRGLLFCDSFICLIGAGCFPFLGTKLGVRLLGALLHGSRCRSPDDPVAEVPVIPLWKFQRSRCGGSYLGVVAVVDVCTVRYVRAVVTE